MSHLYARYCINLPIRGQEILESHTQTLGEFNLPVASELPPPRFSYIHTDKAPPGFKWIDNKKCIFTVDVEAISSVHTENKELDTFLHKTAGLQLGQKPARMSDKESVENGVCYRT